jgi:hypothetical protein
MLVGKKVEFVKGVWCEEIGRVNRLVVDGCDVDEVID